MVGRPVPTKLEEEERGEAKIMVRWCRGLERVVGSV